MTVSINSWEYLVDFKVINPRSRLDGDPLILGRPWLGTTDAYIGCRASNMIITQGNAMRNLVLYPLAKPSLPIVNTQLHPPRYLEENICSPLKLEEAIEFTSQMEDDVIRKFINRLVSMNNLTCQVLKPILDNEAHGDPLMDADNQHIPSTTIYNIRPIEIELGKMLNINNKLDSHQQQRSIQVLRKYKKYFS